MGEAPLRAPLAHLTTNSMPPNRFRRRAACAQPLGPTFSELRIWAGEGVPGSMVRKAVSAAPVAKSVKAAKKKPSPALPPISDKKKVYVVPGDDVEDEDLVFSRDNWSLSERTRFLDPSLSERTRILGAIFARMQVPPSVGLASWALSGLFSDDPNVVLNRLPGADNDQKRQSQRKLPGVTRKTILDMARRQRHQRRHIFHQRAKNGARSREVRCH